VKRVQSGRAMLAAPRRSRREQRATVLQLTGAANSTATAERAERHVRHGERCEVVLRADEAVARIALAREKRKTKLGIAECLVRMKELDSLAVVECRRLEETGASERCRIVEEHRSSRFERSTGVQHASIVEREKTERQKVAADRETEREAVAAHAMIETRRLRSEEGQAGFGSYCIAIVLGMTISELAASTVLRSRRDTWRRNSLLKWCLRLLCTALTCRVVSSPPRIGHLLGVVLRLLCGQLSWGSLRPSERLRSRRALEEMQGT